MDRQRAEGRSEDDSHRPVDYSRGAPGVVPGIGQSQRILKKVGANPCDEDEQEELGAHASSDSLGVNQVYREKK